MINRNDYLDGTISHDAYYLTLVDIIGREAIETLVLKRIADVGHIRTCLKTDVHLNNIPLRLWDALDTAVQRLARKQWTELRPIMWPEGNTAGKFYWSLSDSVCILKAAAKRMAQ
jgi:hypothetical protein